MSDSPVITEISGCGRATVLLNRPQVHNAFDETLVAALLDELRQLENNDRVRVVLLAARGKNFCAGADLKWMLRSAGYSRERNLADAEAMAQLMTTLHGLKQPTIALVHGAVYGGGVGILACCDVALAARDARFCFSEVRLGLIPAVISPFVVAAIGARAARRYFLSAERFGAEEACRLGLVHEVVESDSLRQRGLALAEEMLKNGPQALLSAKELVGTVEHRPIDGQLLAELAERIAAIRTGAEAKEGIGAFLQKRKPPWRDR